MVIKRQYMSTVLEKKDKAIQGKRRAHKKTRIRRKNKVTMIRRENKVKVGNDFSSDKNHDFKLVPKFLKNASKDILLEIFLRLPNYRYAILSSSVCCHWHSVISQPHFIPSFVRHHHDHKDRYILPCTIIFRSSDIFSLRAVQYYQLICKLFSEESTFLHEKASSSSFLDFMPLSMIIRASFDDLLLVSPDGRRAIDYYICNPVTKQWFQLPKSPIHFGISGFALVCMPDDCSNKQLGAQYQYKVVLIAGPYLAADDVVESNHTINADIFCSKSGRWCRSFFSYPPPKEFKRNGYLEIVTCKGVLYWQENEFTSTRIISLDLFNGARCSVIDTPDDLVQDSCGKTHLGVVGGELRFLHVFNMTDKEECCFIMKVWELKYNEDDSTSWFLVHEINLGANNTKKMVRWLAVHPNNGDVVFMIWGKHLFKYTITQNMHEMVDKLQESICSYERVLSIPLVHPAMPTPVPSHPVSI